MEARIKEALKTKKLRATGRGGSGCINEGEAYETDDGEVFIKRNSKPAARTMFDGEFAALKAILDTQTVRVPKPIAVVDNPAGGAALIMESVRMRQLGRHSEQLGKQLASLHLHNSHKRDESSSVHGPRNESGYVDQFGFGITTCCGYLPLDNTWHDDWVEFFCRQRIDAQVRMAQEKYHDREAPELWALLVHKVPSFFEGLEIEPALLHGDLWGGNIAECEDGPNLLRIWSGYLQQWYDQAASVSDPNWLTACSVIFDPASYYGHSEFELSIAKLFGGFDAKFYSAYFKAIPKAPGFEKRLDFYHLFHYLNHWNHFGGGYRSSSLSTMRRLLK